MLKFLTLKLLLILTFFFIVPSQQVLFAQNDDSFEEEDWSDDMLEESLDDPATDKATKSSTLNENVSGNDDNEKSITKKDAKKAKEEAKLAKTKAKEDAKLAKIKAKEDAKLAKERAKEDDKLTEVEGNEKADKSTPDDNEEFLEDNLQEGNDGSVAPVVSDKNTEAITPQPQPEEKPAPVIRAPVASKPKAVFEPIKAPEQNYKVGAVKRAGPPLLVIARPVYAPYSNEGKTMFISATAESYFHFKLGALPGISVVSVERMCNNIQYYRDFSRRISSTVYKEATKKIGATYLFYSEYEPNGKKVKFATELYSIIDNKKIAGSVAEIELSKFEDGLFDFVNEAAGALIGAIPQTTQEFLAAPVFKNKGESLGELIVSVSEYSKKRAETVAPQFEKMAKDNSNHLAKFVASQNFVQAGQFDKAIPLMQQLAETFGNQYPALQLKLSQLYRQNSAYDDALQAAGEAANEPSLKLPAKIEKARIQEAQGNLQQAKREYEAVLTEGGEDGEILFQLALVNIGLNDLREAENYLEKAASAGRILDRGDYFDLGLRYEAIGTATEQAITAYRNCLGLQQDNVDAWLKLSDLYALSGRESDAAECYVSLFQIDNNLYRDYLVKAGTMYENSGYFDNAKDVYELYIGRRFDNPEVKVRLAKLEMQSNNCPKAIQLVDNMDTTGPFGQEIIDINTQCKKDVRVVVATGTQDKSWKAMFFWRVSSSVIFLGGGAAGYLMEQQVKKKMEEYDTYPIDDRSTSAAQKVADINALHNDIEKFQKMRNYSYLGAGIGGASLFLSIVFPIMIK